MMMGMEDESNEAAPAKGIEIALPESVLAIDGTAPSDGDEVEFTVKGRKTRTEGGNAYVSVESVNGEPVSAPAETKEPGFDDLRKMAEEEDQASVTA
jgi:hypothetical protein